MAELSFLVMNETQAARFAEDTATDENRLEPRKIDNGPYAGWYALPRSVLFDDNFVAHRDAFDQLSEVALDPDVVFNPVEV